MNRRVKEPSAKADWVASVLITLGGAALLWLVLAAQ